MYRSARCLETCLSRRVNGHAERSPPPLSYSTLTISLTSPHTTHLSFDISKDVQFHSTIIYEARHSLGSLPFWAAFTPSVGDDIRGDISGRQPRSSALLAPCYLLFVDLLTVVEVWAIFEGSLSFSTCTTDAAVAAAWCLRTKNSLEKISRKLVATSAHAKCTAA